MNNITSYQNKALWLLFFLPSVTYYFVFVLGSSIINILLSHGSWNNIAPSFVQANTLTLERRHPDEQFVLILYIEIDYVKIILTSY